MSNEKLSYSQSFPVNTRTTMLFAGKFVNPDHTSTQPVKNVTDLIQVTLHSNEINVSFDYQTISPEGLPEGFSPYTSGFIFVFPEGEPPEEQKDYLILCEDVYESKGTWTVDVGDTRYTVTGFFNEEA